MNSMEEGPSILVQLTLGVGDVFVWAVPGIAGCLAACLVFTQWMPVASPNLNQLCNENISGIVILGLPITFLGLGFSHMVK